MHDHVSHEHPERAIEPSAGKVVVKKKREDKGKSKTYNPCGQTEISADDCSDALGRSSRDLAEVQVGRRDDPGSTGSAERESDRWRIVAAADETGQL